jgi:hypothetical protein
LNLPHYFGRKTVKYGILHQDNDRRQSISSQNPITGVSLIERNFTRQTSSPLYGLSRAR